MIKAREKVKKIPTIYVTSSAPIQLPLFCRENIVFIIIIINYNNQTISVVNKYVGGCWAGLAFFPYLFCYVCKGWQIYRQINVCMCVRP
jgi:hypothetical protein